MNRFYETIYSSLPIPAQNLFCSLAGYRRFRERFNARFHSRLRAWEETIDAPLARLHEIQRDRLATLVGRAREHVPYYGDVPPVDARTAATIRGKLLSCA